MDKQSRYQHAFELIKAFVSPKGYVMTEIGKMASITAILHRAFPEWPFVGFYRVIENNTLEIGPYHGSVLACGKISFGKGVCGTAAKKQKTLIIDNVLEFPEYIACDSDTKSEIVVPVIRNNKTVAVLDVDSADMGSFDHVDQKYLEKIAAIL